MAQTRFFYFAGLAAFLLVHGLPVNSLQTAEPHISAQPARLEIVAGENATLQIILENANQAYGIDLQANFDPAQVEVVDSNTHKSGIQLSAGDFPKADYTLINSADNNTGQLRYVVTELAPSQSVSGRGVVLSIQLRAKAAGGISRLEITSAAVADRKGRITPVQAQGADLVIVATKSPTLTPTSPAPLSTASAPPVGEFYIVQPQEAGAPGANSSSTTNKGAFLTVAALSAAVAGLVIGIVLALIRCRNKNRPSK